MVFFNGKKGKSNNFNYNENLKVLEWPNKRPTGIKDFLFAFSIMKKNKPNVILSNFSANNIMLIAGWLLRVKVRMCYHHTIVAQFLSDGNKLSLHQRITIFRKKIVYRLATHLLPPSTASKEDLIKYYNADVNKIFIFPNALPDTHTLNTSFNFTIGFIGRFDYSKGVDILLDAFSNVIMHMPQAKLIAIGSGQLFEQMRQKAKSISDNIIFTGPLANQEIISRIQEFNFLVVPSRYDNLPTVIIEAFSTQTPVIASNTGGIPDMVTNDYNGLLVDPENVKALSKAIIFMLENKKERDKMALNARQTFLEKYNIDTLLQRFENLLQTSL